MAQFLRGKQAGIQHDLSEGLAADFFKIDEVCLGISGILFRRPELTVSPSLHDVV